MSLAGATSAVAEIVGEPERNFRKSAEGFRFSRTAQLSVAHRAYDLQGTTIEVARIWKKFEEDLDAMLPKCDVIVLNTLVTEKTRYFNNEKIAKLEKDTQAVVDACLSGYAVKEEFIKVGKLMRGKPQVVLVLLDSEKVLVVSLLRFARDITESVLVLRMIRTTLVTMSMPHILLDGCYHEVGPKRVKLTVRWFVLGTLGEDDRANFILLHDYLPERSQILSGEPSQQTMGGPYLRDDDTQFDDLS
ncbi:formate dehydrogenase (NAD+) [Orobanche gracilis]